MSKPLVSIFTPAYNCASYIDKTIRSVLAQSYSNFEYIIVDDCSTDETLEIIKGFKDSRIRLIENKTNKGISHNRNIGIKESKGEYLAMVDGDDLMAPDRIKLQVEFLEINKDYGLLGTEIIKIDSSGNSIGNIVKYELPHDEIPSRMLFNNYLATSSVMIRLNCLNDKWFKEEFVVAEDYELWIQIIRKNKIGHINQPLTSYRIHSESISSKREQLMLETDYKILQIQLKELGFSASDKEFKLLFDIGKNRLELYKSQFDFFHDTLSKLYEKNLSTMVFEPASFQRLLFRYWHDIFVNIKDFNLKLNSKIKSSPMFPLLTKSEKLKLAFKSTINLKKK